MAALRILGHLWTLPNTFLGLLVGTCLTFGRPRRPAGRGFLVFASGRGISKRDTMRHSASTQGSPPQSCGVKGVPRFITSES